MKKLVLPFLLVLLLCGVAHAVTPKASKIDADTTNFDNNLSSADTTVQKALDTLDDMSGGSGGGAPTDATYITQTANSTLTAEQALSALSTGLMKVTTGTGAITSITDGSTNWNTAYGWGDHSSAGYLTAETNDLETDGAAGIADTEIFIGTGADTGNYAALSGDATMANDGTVTIADSVAVSSWNLTTPTLTTNFTFDSVTATAITTEAEGIGNDDSDTSFATNAAIVDYVASNGDGTGTDDQTIDAFALDGTTLQLSLEDDGEATKEVDLSGLQDGYEANTDDQTIDVSELDGTTLKLSLEDDGEATKEIDLSSLQDGTGTDDQTIDVSELDGTTLKISLEGDGEATKEIDLSSLQDGYEANTDAQGFDVSELDGTTLKLSLDNDAEATKEIDLSSLQDGTGTDDQTLAEALASGADANDLAITSLAKLEGVDDAVYVDLGNDTYANIAADAYIDLSTPDVKVQDNIQLDSDGAIIELGADQDVTLTHVADTGVQMELDDKIMFGDTAVFIHSDDDGYLDLDADTGIRLNGTVSTTANIAGTPRHLIFNIFDPLGVQTDDGEVCIWPVTPAALTVTKIVVTLDASGNEVAGDLKYADAFIGLANAAVINAFDTTSGVLSDDSITSGAVAAGKCIYISFDSAPNEAITQMCVDVTYDFD